MVPWCLDRRSALDRLLERLFQDIEWSHGALDRKSDPGRPRYAGDVRLSASGWGSRRKNIPILRLLRPMPFPRSNAGHLAASSGNLAVAVKLGPADGAGVGRRAAAR